MKRLPSQDRTLIVLGLVAVAAVLALLVVVLPLRAKARQLSREAEALQAKIGEAETMYGRFPTEAARLANLEKQIGSVCRPQANPSPEVVREIQQLSSDLGLQLISVRPSEPTVGEGYTKFATTFELQASFADIVRLLYELETPPHSLWVDAAEITSDQGGGADLRATVTVAAYVHTAAERKSDAKT
jgi:Tfp pilus assembly protein PilO